MKILKDSFNKKTVLITGIYGQDAYFLSKSLIKSGYTVFGTTRKKKKSYVNQFVKEKNIFELNIEDYDQIAPLLKKIDPNYIYHLSAQSSVALSFLNPDQTKDSIIKPTLNLLRYLKNSPKKIKFYNACSSECFGDTNGIDSNELTPFNPISPYGVYKSEAFNLVKSYREKYSLNLRSGILFNHESEIRSEAYVTQKIVHAAYKASQNKIDKLEIGNVLIKRDWGYAPEYVEAMRLINELDHNEDFIVATGHSFSLENFLEIAFNYFGLDFKDYVKTNKKFFREKEIINSSADPSKISNKLGWNASIYHEKLVEKLCKSIEEKSFISKRL